MAGKLDFNSLYGLIQNQPQNKNNLLATRFRFITSKIPNVVYFCQSVQIPGLKIGIVDQYTIFNPIKRPGGEVRQEDLSLTFLMDENLLGWSDIRNWILECSNYIDFDKYKKPEVHLVDDALLLILDNNNNPKYKIQFTGLFPNTLGGIQFDSKMSESQFLIADALFSYTSYEIYKL